MNSNLILNTKFFKNFVDEQFECTVRDDVVYIKINPYPICIEFINNDRTKHQMIERSISLINEQFCLLSGDYHLDNRQEIKDILERNVKYV